MQDVQALYEDAMTILNDPRGMDPYKTSFIEGYFSAMFDILHNRWEPNTEVIDETLAETLENIWQRKNAIVEDDRLRQIFCLLCQKVIKVCEW